MAKKPVVLVVMDGVGINDNVLGNAVKMAYKPHLDELWENCPHTQLRAHGLAVGLPTDDDMGNSEVGHNAIGSGQIYSQGAKLVNENIESKEMFNSTAWKELVQNVKDHASTLHFLGLLSSHINHLKALIEQAKTEGVKRVRLHVLLDGRDVPETSALTYIDEIESFMAGLNDANFDAQIASGGGRMKITMDRYEANWPMVEEGWKIHVRGLGRQFHTATEAIETYRNETGVVDQDLPGFVLVDEAGQPKGTIDDNDSVILFNFRGDRAQEISLAFDGDESFNKFDRVKVPAVKFAGMLQYDADAQIPKNYLTEPPKIHYTLTEQLVQAGLNEYAISETQKYGHVTYFWNGNRSAKFDENLETYVEIESDVIPFEQRPWMKSAEITDQLCEAIRSGKYDFLRTNYPNGDMVGHTGSLEATVVGVEAVDLALGRVLEAVKAVDGVLLITADHGNADEMYEKQKKPGAPLKAKTSHTLNRVPFIVYNYDCELKQDDDLGLSNIAATVCEILGVEPNEHWRDTIIKH
mgnify:FL=1